VKLLLLLKSLCEFEVAAAAFELNCITQTRVQQAIKNEKVVMECKLQTANCKLLMLLLLPGAAS